MKNHFKKFIKLWSYDDGPLGDVATDILTDKNLSKNGTDDEIMQYLEPKTLSNGTNHLFLELKELYLESK